MGITLTVIDNLGADVYLLDVWKHGTTVSSCLSLLCIPNKPSVVIRCEFLSVWPKDGRHYWTTMPLESCPNYFSLLCIRGSHRPNFSFLQNICDMRGGTRGYDGRQASICGCRDCAFLLNHFLHGRKGSGRQVCRDESFIVMRRRDSYRIFCEKLDNAWKPFIRPRCEMVTYTNQNYSTLRVSSGCVRKDLLVWERLRHPVIWALISTRISHII